jgi:predicted acylesterase/phospholipase RssA/CRP-like cAMP-binding protein
MVRSVPSEFRRHVASTALFSALDGEALDDLAGRLAFVHVRAGDTLFLQGGAADSLYIILDGRLRLTTSRADGRREVVCEIVRGNCAAAAALIGGTPHSATARAVRDSQLLQLTREEFDAVAARHPLQVLRVVQRVLAMGSGDTRSRSQAAVATIAVAPASVDVPTGGFIHRLAERLSARGDVECLTSSSATIWRRGRSVPTPRVVLDPHVSPVSDNGNRAALRIYETDAGASAWTEACLSRADRILVVANATGDPACGDIERELLSSRQRLPAHRDLILLHPSNLPRVEGTKRWLEHRYVDAHHHVCLESNDDVDRVGRFLTGRAIGLVLSGGGARAFAHIGVIRAFREAGIPIDVVAGVSMGAMIGAQLALGWDPVTMAQRNREAWIDRKPLIDYTVPILGLISGGRFKSMLAWMFGDTQIEDLQIPYFCMSANLTRAEPVVHWDGPLRRWVRASVSLPGIAPPLPDRGELLADGGLITNLPVDVMRLFVDGPIIASDVASRIPLEVDSRLDDHPSAWRFVGNRLNPFARPLSYPTLFNVMWRTVLLSSVRAVEDARRDADFYVHPDVDTFRLFEWEAIDRIVDEGYRAASTAIAGWKNDLPD